jgi:rhodanese-related sulfurtransferase
MKKLILLCITIFIISFGSLANEISAIEAAKKLKDNIMIIDVRNKSEWKETGVIPGAKLIQMLSSARTIRKEYISELMDVLGEDKNIEAAIICHSGGRSSATVAMLKEKGFTNIFNVSEGMVGNGNTTGWTNRNLPIKKCDDACK